MLKLLLRTKETKIFQSMQLAKKVKGRAQSLSDPMCQNKWPSLPDAINLIVEWVNAQKKEGRVRITSAEVSDNVNVGLVNALNSLIHLENNGFLYREDGGRFFYMNKEAANFGGVSPDTVNRVIDVIISLKKNGLDIAPTVVSDTLCISQTTTARCFAKLIKDKFISKTKRRGGKYILEDKFTLSGSDN